VSERWRDLVYVVPPELRPYLLEFEWDPRKLHALPLASEPAPTAALEWHLDLPWWRFEGRPFAIDPRSVMEDPERYPEQYARTLNADLRHPLDITRRAGRWVVMDGIHRLAKAMLLELEHVRVRKVPRSAFGEIRRRDAA
jgi:hypothetical protein